MDDVRDFLFEGYSERKAIRTALNKNRPRGDVGHRE